jgi:hypothetical protein
MDPSTPGTPETVDSLADELALTACTLADWTAHQGWTPAAVDDALDALAVVTEALATARPDTADALAGLQAALEAARQALTPAAPGTAGPALPEQRAGTRRRLSSAWRQRANLPQK